MSKDLKEVAIDIKGKQYVLVSDRIIFFNDTYANGSITTELLSDVNADLVVMRAIVIPDVANPTRRFTGYSQATWGEGYINKTSALENCETSAIGRALGMMGIGVIDSIASVDEINKAQTQSPKAPYKPVETPKKSISLDELTYEQFSKLSEEKQKGVKDLIAKKNDLPFISDEEVKQFLK